MKRFIIGLLVPAFFTSQIALVVLNAAPNDYEKVFITTKENIRLAGFFRSPDPGQPVVVMLHGLASAKEEWLPITDKLNQKGYGWLIYDARGHGESSLTKGSDGSANGYRYFGSPGPGSQWERMIDDLGVSLQFLEKNKQIKRDRIFLMGASLGANVALNYASLTRFRTKLVLLSPGLNYQEIKTDEAVKKLNDSPLLIVTHPADSYAHGSALQLKMMSSKIETWSDVKPGHGVQMFDSMLMDRIILWLSQRR